MAKYFLIGGHNYGNCHYGHHNMLKYFVIEKVIFMEIIIMVKYFVIEKVIIMEIINNGSYHRNDHKWKVS